ncbi:MAG: signal peptidase I [Kyrpidia sp.]|uniref:Signal peptidase I n=3 Tax=Alicyclobacillaceae TaxID=186823 RepID=A0A6F9EAU9_9BACL|nr:MULTISPECIES: signal peptidase I [Kyrpidia]MCL6575973.1 signal peptidase I [Kyrpidia sp.]CAB3392618.1 putative signal peptidase I-1 [Kyrpidia spormannii]CAB3393536.1 putative signal peptidase I-1 [Kyrpidia spormannii]
MSMEREQRPAGEAPEGKTRGTSSWRELWEWAVAIAVALLLAYLIRLFVFEIFVVDGESMEPTLHNEERLIVDKLVYDFHPPQYGDVVIFRYPGDPSQDFVKRVIGLPGDRIEIRDGVVYRNGQPLSEPYIAAPPRAPYGPVVVPPGHLFVMGDNRNHSKDSRDPTVGMVPDANVIGRADVIFWPFSQFRIQPFR